MSHLTSKVEGQEANRQGLLSLSLNDLPEVNITTPTTGQGLKYDSGSSEWVADTISGTFDVGAYAITSGVAASALASPLYSSGNELYGFYMSARSKLYNDILMTFSDNTNLEIQDRVINLDAKFVTGFVVAAGAKLLMSCDVVLAEGTSSTSHIDLQWQTTTGAILGPLVRCKVQAGYNRNRVVGFYHNQTAGDVEIGMKRLNQSGGIQYPQSTATRQEYILLGREF